MSGSLRRMIGRLWGPGSGRGGATGTPNHNPVEEAPPSLDQEKNWTVSGGGQVSDDGPPSDKAHRSQ